MSPLSSIASFTWTLRYIGLSPSSRELKAYGSGVLKQPNQLNRGATILERADCALGNAKFAREIKLS